MNSSDQSESPQAVSGNVPTINQTDDKTSFLGQYLSAKGTSRALPTIDNSEAERHLLADIMKSDHEALTRVLLDTLGPELRDNEKQKRLLKQRLMEYILIILSIQLFFFLFIVGAFTICFCIDIPFFRDISLDQLESITSFLQYYISAVVAEFIAMLFFIVKFVFDASIVKLIEEVFDRKK